MKEMEQKTTKTKRRKKETENEGTNRKKAKESEKENLDGRISKREKRQSEEAAVDAECAELRGKAKVFVDGKGRRYDVMLSQTNIQQNNNKFYLIQLLCDQTTANKFWVWFRWGRVGFKGQKNLVPFGTDFDGALELFHGKFTDKTQNDFLTDIKKFKKVAGKYDLIKIDHSREVTTETERDAKVRRKVAKTEAKALQKMDERVRTLLDTICDLKAMESDARQLEYDFKRIPLGKITKEQLRFGYEALGRIERHVQKGTFGRDFVEAMNDYYTRIPHSFGMRTPPPIKSPEELKRENELLKMLTGIEITVSNIGADPLECHYARLRWDLIPLEKDDANFKIVEEYLQGTHGPTHDKYRMKVRNVFELSAKGTADDGGKRNGAEEKRKSANNGKGKGEKRRKTQIEQKGTIGNRKLLWHGSRLANWYSILAKGLRIAPPEAPSTGFMFGKGLYFADISSKSANYSLSDPKKPGFLLLSAVALGEAVELKEADSKMHQKLPKGKNSVRGVGHYVPHPNGRKTIDGDVEVPCGKPIKNTELCADDETSLIYNEFVVYSLDQIQERFLVEVQYEFDFGL
ncbi:hypothetical protein niasHT_017090 [Heterodera trifolii]|uniref:Poly [ADP-ribose] polymerase n=1 Tax=Heterodera trifolii TaxID=157864 RepID=A0ABD2KY40_9BILA